jgi:hypothetical protein
MSENKKLCVVIPVHRANLSVDEVVSLKACKNRLERYDCYLIFPEGMDVSLHLAIHNQLILKPVNPMWLSSIANYNVLKTQLEFYELFEDYTFMFTYELDSYIFDSDIEKTGSLRFDYIGAPFFDGYLDALPEARFIDGGNSGFSIRNIQSCIRVLKSMDNFKLHWFFYKVFFSRFPALRFHLNRLTKSRYDIYINGKLDFYFLKHHMNEDMVWSQVVPKLFPFFKVADPATALKFSFEANPDKLLNMNKGQLPVGCHGWPKNKLFWQKYIDFKQ